jgi:PIN domain nuclease of toxin-antitoxin system
MPALPGMRLAPMPPEVLIDSAFLPGTPPRDPADRILAATARAASHILVTRDSELIPYAQQGHLRVLVC